MRLFLLPLILSIIVGLCVDIYILNALRRRFTVKWPIIAHVAVFGICMAAMVVAICLPGRSESENYILPKMWILFSWLTVYIPKFVFFIADALAHLPAIFWHKKLKLLSVAGVIMAVGVFAAMWWAAVINRYEIDVREVSVEIPDLPVSFDGYRIVQFSDAHVGTYGTDTAFVSGIVDRINSLKADAVMFTGDIVNIRAEELDPHVPVFSRLSARDGIYSILGNHDYGDYCRWKDDTSKKANLERLCELTKSMGWSLLRDSHVWIVHGTDSLAVIGVENIGDAPFPTYGSLRRAYPSIGDNQTKILLTHNPAHWVDSIYGRDEMNIALTLSGHTHAMQCEIFGWSPAKYRYSCWGGLYDSPRGQQIYVNIGTGTVGLPARLGATPEITVITLKRTTKR